MALGSTGVLPAIVQISLGHHAKGTNGGQYPALGAVDLVHAIPFSNGPPLAPVGQVEILRENMSRVVSIFEIAVTAAAAATAVSIDVATVAVISRSRIVSVRHDWASRLAALRAVGGVSATSASSMSRRATGLQFAFGARCVGSVLVRCVWHSMADGLDWSES